MSKKINLSEIELSFDETYHIYKGSPLYNKRFKKVMSFHHPGIAAVYDDTGAYHIDIEGNPIYKERYEKVYGFYEGIATVSDNEGYFHIDTEGKKIHNKKFEWSGNFQEGRCVVRDFNDNYFHIKPDGERAYKENYRYVGDFKYGIAVVYLKDGYATHIDKNGNFIHGKKFIELDVYHKGYAIARDEFGYFHIDKKGNSLYRERYEWVEPFYNDYALMRDFVGVMKVIDEKGNTVKEILPENTEVNIKRNFKVLSNKLVGYWHTQILYSIAKLEILELLGRNDLSKEEIKNLLNLPDVPLNLLLDYLSTYKFIKISDKSDKYKLTSLGKLFIERLKYPALMWGDEHYTVMSKLLDALLSGEEQFSKIYGKKFFDYINLDENREKLDIYQKSMAIYSLDYDTAVENMNIPESVKTIADIGGGNEKLLCKILKKFPHIEKAYLFDLPNTIKRINVGCSKKIKLVGGNFFQNIELSNLDMVVSSRVLHDWSDENVNIILRNINKTLKLKGKLYLLETVIPEKPNYDIGISLSFNLLTMVGGRERRLAEFKKLLNDNGFNLTNVKNIGIISLIEAEKSFL